MVSTRGTPSRDNLEPGMLGGGAGAVDPAQGSNRTGGKLFGGGQGQRSLRCEERTAEVVYGAREAGQRGRHPACLL